MKKTLFAIFVVTILLFTGCGSSKKMIEEDMDNNYGALKEDAKEESIQAETRAEKKNSKPKSIGGASSEDKGMEDSATANNIESTRKIIKTGSLYIETTEYEETIKKLMKLVDMKNGYIFSSESFGGDKNDTYSTRNCRYEIKVPAQNFDAFMSGSEDVGDVINKSEHKDDVTSTYRDTEARLKTLKVQEDRLLKILEKADDLKSVIELEKALADVRYQIEGYETSKRQLDDKIDYSKINVVIEEIVMRKKYESKPITFGEKIKYAFENMLENTGDFFENTVLFFIYALPTLIFLAIIAFIAIKVIKKATKKRKSKQKAEVEQNNQNNIEEK